MNLISYKESLKKYLLTVKEETKNIPNGLRPVFKLIPSLESPVAVKIEIAYHDILRSLAEIEIEINAALDLIESDNEHVIYSISESLDYILSKMEHIHTIIDEIITYLNDCLGKSLPQTMIC